MNTENADWISAYFKVTDCLTTVKSINKTDAITLLSAFSVSASFFSQFSLQVLINHVY